MCSFAKFLALGLIASEGRGPVVVEALSDIKYKEIVGATYAGTTKTDAARQTAACAQMYVSYKDLATPTPANLGITGLQVNSSGVTACDASAFSALKTKMLTAWKADAKALELAIESTATIDGDSKNVKKLLLDALQNRYKTWNSGTGVALTAGDAFNKRIKEVKKALWLKRTPAYQSVAGKAYGETKNDSKPLTPQLVKLRSAIADKEKERDTILAEGVKVAKSAQTIADEALKNNSNMKLQQQAKWTREAAEKIANSSSAETIAGAEELKKQATALETNAKEILAQVKQERAEAVGGFFGVLAGLAIAFVALLFSPCFQYDFKNHAFDWETDNYERPAYYQELDGTARDWRNEANQFLGLPKEPSVSAGKVDSSKASSSALTVVPVVFVAGGAFAIARGLKKRRAQKKAKRASRAQVKVLYEDL